MRNVVINDIEFDPGDEIFDNNCKRINKTIGSDIFSLSLDWFNSSAEACRQNSFQTRMFEVMDTERGEIVGIIPYYICKQKVFRYFNVKTIHLMKFYKEYGDHYDMLIEPEYLETVLEKLSFRLKQKNIDICYICNLHRNAMISKLKKFRSKYNLLVGRKEESNIYYINLKNISDIGMWLGTKFKRVRKYKNKLERNFNVTYNIVNEPSQFDRVFKSYLRLHEKRFTKSDTKSSITSDPIQISFLKKICERSLLNENLHLCYIEIDGEIASVDITFKYKKNGLAYTTTFDQKYADYRLGSIQLLHTLEVLSKNEVEIFDFLQGEEEYKKYWATDIFNDYSFRIYNQTPRGIFFYFLDMVTYLPSYLRRFTWVSRLSMRYLKYLGPV